MDDETKEILSREFSRVHATLSHIRQHLDLVPDDDLQSLWEDAEQKVIVWMLRVRRQFDIPYEV